jgi:dihydroorotase
MALLALGLLISSGASAQDFDLLIDNGHVIDPKNGTDAVMDVGILDGKIAEISTDISPSRAQNVVDASGLYVTPGLIDMHVHVFHGTEQDAYISDSFTSVPPDAFTFRSGVTTAVDVGSAGWRNIRDFIAQTVDNSDTRVLAFLNIVGSGMKGGAIEQNLTDMDPKLTAMTARRFSDIVVGVKLAHYNGREWEPADRAVEAGRQADVPVMIDFGSADPPLSIEELFFEHLRPGDIFTHAYANLDGRESIVDENGQLKPFVIDAQSRGIVFDVGHGGGSFMYSAGVPASRAGFWPNTISTDLHTGSMNGGMKDVSNVMSKFINLGMPLADVIEATTWKPAQVIKRTELGHLDIGAEADVAVFRLREGDFGFVDTRGYSVPGDRKLETELTLRAGRVVWDLNGIAASAWED